jgi:predicted ATP-binding protein involved in virulence
MRITKIIVTKLFGIFDHEIPLNLDDRITIIHATNGFGKTIILRMLNGLFNGDYTVFLSIPFEKFEVEFDDDIIVWVEKEENKEEYGDQIQTVLFDESDDYGLIQKNRNIVSKITINMSKGTEDNPKSFAYSYKNMEKSGNMSLIRQIETRIPGLERIGPEKWLYEPTGESISVYEILERFGHFLNADEPGWWMKFQKKIGIRFIQTQRLQNFNMDLDQSIPTYRRRATIIPMVEEYASDLKEEIKQKLAESASLSQSLDRTFPERLINQMQKKNHSKSALDTIGIKLGELEEKRIKLMDAGLLDEKAVSDFRIPEKTSQDTKEVLTVYVVDVEKKLSIFDELAEKISLFKEMINKRFLYKEIIISKKSGFHFITSDKKILPLSALSSGEQHELILLYQLLFKTKPNTVILIDEPEISLHVAWQIEFLKDLQRIVDLAELDVIIATHSPQIINDRWDLTVELESPVSYEAISHTK